MVAFAAKGLNEGSDFTEFAEIQPDYCLGPRRKLVGPANSWVLNQTADRRMELHGLKLDHLVIGNPLFKERILVNEGVRFFSGLNSSDDDTAGSWHAGSGNEQFFCAIPLVKKFAVS